MVTLLFIFIILLAWDLYTRAIEHSDAQIDRLHGEVDALRTQGTESRLQQLTNEAILDMVNEVQLGKGHKQADAVPTANRSRRGKGRSGDDEAEPAA